MSFETRITLIQRMEQGDQLAWSEGYTTYSNLIRYWASRTLFKEYQTKENFDEIIQLTMLELYKNIHTFKKDLGSFKNFLRWQYRRGIDKYRRQNFDKMPKADPDTIDNLPASQPFAPGINEEDYEFIKILTAQALKKTYAAISEIKRRSVRMNIIREISPDDIAKQLDISRGAVDQHKYSFLQQLRKNLGKCFEEHQSKYEYEKIIFDAENNEDKGLLEKLVRDCVDYTDTIIAPVSKSELENKLSFIRTLLNEIKFPTDGDPALLKMHTKRDKNATSFNVDDFEVDSKWIPLEKKETVIGKNEKLSDICLSDDDVSGSHAIITKQKDGLVLRDADSTNGTYINGKAAKIEKVFLNSGDIFQIGQDNFFLFVE